MAPFSLPHMVLSVNTFRRPESTTQEGSASGRRRPLGLEVAVFRGFFLFRVRGGAWFRA